MKGYLLDTNIWSNWFEQKPFVVDEIQRLEPNSLICLSVVVWGEAVYGAKLNVNFSFDKYKEFIHGKKPMTIPVDEAVAEEFGELKAVLFEKKSPRNLRTNVGRQNQLKNPLAAKEMQIQENDLWLAAQALAYNLVLITSDRMQTILELAPKELKHELWQVK